METIAKTIEEYKNILPIDIYDLDAFEVSAGGKMYRGYFTSLRVDRNKLAEGLYAYDIRDTDNGDDFCEIKNFVMVNHGGTFLTKEIIPGAISGIPIEKWAFLN